MVSTTGTKADAVPTRFPKQTAVETLDLCGLPPQQPGEGCTFHGHGVHLTHALAMAHSCPNLQMPIENASRKSPD